MLAQLLENAKAYVLGTSTLQELEEWLLANLQDILDSGDERAADIANELDADLVEFAEGIMDESSIRAHLQRYMVTLTPVIYTDSPTAVSTDVLIIIDSAPAIEREFKLVG